MELSLFYPLAVLPNTNSFFFLFPLYNLLILLPLSVLLLPPNPYPRPPHRGLLQNTAQTHFCLHAFLSLLTYLYQKDSHLRLQYLISTWNAVQYFHPLTGWTPLLGRRRFPLLSLPHSHSSLLSRSRAYQPDGVIAQGISRAMWIAGRATASKDKSSHLAFSLLLYW